MLCASKRIRCVTFSDLIVGVVGGIQRPLLEVFHTLEYKSNIMNDQVHTYMYYVHSTYTINQWCFKMLSLERHRILGVGRSELVLCYMYLTLINGVLFLTWLRMSSLMKFLSELGEAFS